MGNSLEEALSAPRIIRECAKGDRLATPTFFGPCGFREDFLRLPYDRSNFMAWLSRSQGLQAYHDEFCGYEVMCGRLGGAFVSEQYEHLELSKLQYSEICRPKIAAALRQANILLVLSAGLLHFAVSGFYGCFSL